MLLRLTDGGSGISHADALTQKFSDVTTLINALEPRIARVMFSKLAEAVLALDPVRRQTLLRRTILPGLLDGKVEGGILRDFPDLGQQVQRLTTCKGIGLVTAAVLIAELPPITVQTDARAIAGWVGLTPRRWQSGNWEGRTLLSRRGDAYVRDALYMPALVAKRYNPLIRTFALRLATNGKTTNAILGAISHKLLRILVGMLRSNANFDPNWAYQKN